MNLEELRDDYMNELDVDAELAKRIINIVIQEESVDGKEVVHIDPLSHHAESRKLRNLKINFKKLIWDSGDIALTLAGALAAPWMIAVASLLAARKIWSNSKIDIDTVHAVVIASSWKEAFVKTGAIRKMEAFLISNKALLENKMRELSMDEFEKILDDLIKLNVIYMVNDIVYFKEEVTFKA